MVFLITISVKKFKKIWFGVAIRVSGEIIKISFSKRRKDVLNAIIRSLTQNWQIKNNNPEAQTVLETINNLFCGKKNVNQLKVDLIQTTKFQKLKIRILLILVRRLELFVQFTCTIFL